MRLVVLTLLVVLLLPMTAFGGKVADGPGCCTCNNCSGFTHCANLQNGLGCDAFCIESVCSAGDFVPGVECSLEGPCDRITEARVGVPATSLWAAGALALGLLTAGVLRFRRKGD